VMCFEQIKFDLIYLIQFSSCVVNKAPSESVRL